MSGASHHLAHGIHLIFASGDGEICGDRGTSCGISGAIPSRPVCSTTMDAFPELGVYPRSASDISRCSRNCGDERVDRTLCELAALLDDITTDDNFGCFTDSPSLDLFCINELDLITVHEGSWPACVNIEVSKDREVEGQSDMTAESRRRSPLSQSGSQVASPALLLFSISHLPPPSTLAYKAGADLLTAFSDSCIVSGLTMSSSAASVPTKRPLETASSTAPMRTVLAAEDRTELDKLWALDKRMPSIQSRRAWANSRELNAGAVHAWFYHMRHRHNKSGGGLAEGTYDLPISAYIPVVIRDTATSLADDRIRKRLKKEHAAQSSEPSTDYMLSDSSTAVGSTEPTTPRNFDGDQYLDWSDFTSSDTFLPSTPTPAPLTPLGKCAYSHLADWNQKASGLAPFSPGFAHNRAGAYASRGAYKVLSACSSEKGLPSVFSQSSSLPPSSPVSSSPSSPVLGAWKPGFWRYDPAHLERERQTQPIPPSPDLRLPLLPASCDCILCQPAIEEDLLVLEPYTVTTRLDFDATLGLSFRFDDSYSVQIEDSGSGVLWVGHGTALDSGMLGPFGADRFMQDWLQQGAGKEELAAMESAYRDAELDQGLNNLYAEQEEEETEYVKKEEEEEEEN